MSETQYVRTCPSCKEQFPLSKTSHGRKKTYCSDACKTTARNARERELRNVVCDECGCELHGKDRHGRKHYCAEHKCLVKTCRICGDSFTVDRTIRRRYTTCGKDSCISEAQTQSRNDWLDAQGIKKQYIDCVCQWCGKVKRYDKRDADRGRGKVCCLEHAAAYGNWLRFGALSTSVVIVDGRVRVPHDSTSNERRTQRIRKNGGRYTRKDVVAQAKRQRGLCYWRNVNPGCLVKLGKNYHGDHVIPVALGGSNDKSNIVAACAKCNGKKAAKHPMDWAGVLC